MEIWKDIGGYEGLYQVSNFGRVKSFQPRWLKERILKPALNSGGYLCVILCKGGKHKSFLIARLVAEAFIPNPEGKPEVDHINTDKTDNRAENLRWATRSENERFAIETGLIKLGEDRGETKLTNAQARHIRENPEGLSQKELAGKFGVTAQTICRVQLGQSYRCAGGVIREKQRGGSPRLPDEQRNQIRELYATGSFSQRALGRKFGISKTTVKRILLEGGD